MLTNIKEKRVIVQSRDLFLSFKAVYTSETLSEKLLMVLKTASPDKVNEADVLGLLL